MKIIFAANVREQLKEISEILYEEEYFGFEDDAIEYIDSFYSVFKKNDNTQWYVFFNYEDEVFMIRYISNNHLIAQYLQF